MFSGSNLYSVIHLYTVFISIQFIIFLEQLFLKSLTLTNMPIHSYTLTMNLNNSDHLVTMQCSAENQNDVIEMLVELALLRTPPGTGCNWGPP